MKAIHYVCSTKPVVYTQYGYEQVNCLLRVFWNMEIKFPVIEKIYSDIVKWVTKDRRKPLPYHEVIIGTFKKDSLAIDIRAKIFLEEKLQPAIEIFLDRVSIRAPYCRKCNRPLQTLRHSEMADFLPYGYSCNYCQIQMNGTHSDIFNEIRGEIRRKYSDFWHNYSKAIYDLTGGKPQKFKIE